MNGPPIEIVAVSPTGRWEVRTHAWEVRMSHWIDTPHVYDRQASRVVYAPEDTTWSLDHAQWVSDSVVQLHLRQYPGGPGMQAIVRIDCAAGTAHCNGRDMALAALDDALARAVASR